VHGLLGDGQAPQLDHGELEQPERQLDHHDGQLHHADHEQPGAQAGWRDMR
jgi:hypothetical protein